MSRSHNMLQILSVKEVIMFSNCKQVQTRQIWTEKEREEIHAQHKMHPEYTYQVLKPWFEEKYPSDHQYCTAISRKAGY